MRRLLLSLSLLAALWGGEVRAQAVPVAVCGTIPLGTLPLGGPRDLYQDQTGKLCVNAAIGSATLGPVQPTLTTTVSNIVTVSPNDAVVQGSATVGQLVVGSAGAATSTPPVASAGNTYLQILDTQQRQIVALWADKGWMVRGVGSTSSSASTTIIAANATNKIYVTTLWCSNAGGVTTTITFNDSVNSTLFLPAGTGNNPSLSIPLVGQSTNSAFQFIPVPASSVVSCSAQGYFGA